MSTSHIYITEIDLGNKVKKKSFTITLPDSDPELRIGVAASYETPEDLAQMVAEYSPIVFTTKTKFEKFHGFRRIPSNSYASIRPPTQKEYSRFFTALIKHRDVYLMYPVKREECFIEMANYQVKKILEENL